MIRRPHQFAPLGTGGAQQPLELQAGHHVGMPISGEISGRRRGRPQGEDDGPHGFRPFHRRVFKIYGPGRADLDAGLATLPPENPAGLRGEVSRLGNGLGEGQVNGLGLAEPEIIRVRETLGANPGALAAAGALVHVHEPGPPAQEDLKIPGPAPDLHGLGGRLDRDQGVAGDFQHPGAQDAHGAVVGGEGLVQLRHPAADGEARFRQGHRQPRGRHLQGGLDAGNAAAHHQHPGVGHPI